MLELKIHSKYLNLNLLIGNCDKRPNPWFTLNKDEDEEEQLSSSKHSFEQALNDLPSDVEDGVTPPPITPTSHITELANKYMNELSGNKPSKVVSLQADRNTPPCEPSVINESDVSPSLASGSTFLHNIGDKNTDELAKEFKDLPDVEIIDNEYEKRLIESAKLVNQRYLMYKETHGID